VSSTVNISLHTHSTLVLTGSFDTPHALRLFLCFAYPRRHTLSLCLLTPTLISFSLLDHIVKNSVTSTFVARSHRPTTPSPRPSLLDHIVQQLRRLDLRSIFTSLHHIHHFYSISSISVSPSFTPYSRCSL
jgi:hypothetical protein